MAQVFKRKLIMVFLYRGAAGKTAVASAATTTTVRAATATVLHAIW